MEWRLNTETFSIPVPFAKKLTSQELFGSLGSKQDLRPDLSAGAKTVQKGGGVKILPCLV